MRQMYQELQDLAANKPATRHMATIVTPRKASKPRSELEQLSERQSDLVLSMLQAADVCAQDHFAT